MASSARPPVALVAALAVLAALLSVAAGQLSRPVATPEDLDLDWNKFLKRTASLDLVNVYDFRCGGGSRESESGRSAEAHRRPAEPEEKGEGRGRRRGEEVEGEGRWVSESGPRGWVIACADR